MTTKTDIANMAFGHIEITKFVDDVDTSKSVDAKVFNLFYPNAVKEMFEQYRPDFVQKYDNLALVETAPNDDWAFSFRYPGDCLFFKRVVSGGGRPGVGEFDSIPYSIGHDNTGKLVYTDFSNVVTGQYIQDFTAVNDMPAGVIKGLSYEMAALIAPGLAKKAPFNSLGLAEKYMKIGMATQKKEKGQGAWPESSAIRARGS